MKSHVIGWVFNMLMTLFVLYVHISGFTTSMIDYRTAEYNLDRDFIANTYLAEKVEIHRTHTVFSRRPMVTMAIDRVSQQLNVDTANAFVIVQFGFMFLSGLLLYYLAFSVFGRIESAVLSTLSYYLSFTIIFAFFTTNYTYDNLLQYALVFGALLLFAERLPILATLLFGLSLFAHESGLLLLPALYVLLSKRSLVERIGAVLGSLIIYGVLLAAMIGTEDGIPATAETLLSRVYLYQFNFQNWRYTIESFFSILLAVGVPTYLLWAYPQALPESSRLTWDGPYKWSLLIVIPVVLFFAKARESRLFATALLFLWPILGPLVKRFFIDLISLSRRYYARSRRAFLLSVIVSIGLSGVLSYIVYQQTGQWPNSNLHNEFLFIALATIGLHHILRRRSSGQLSSRSSGQASSS